MAPAIFAGCLLAAAVHDACALPEIPATVGLPSSVTARYGAARPLSVPPGTSLFVIPTESGIEVRDAATPDPAPVATFRTAGPVRAVDTDGATAYLFAGRRGIVAVDLTNAAQPTVIGAQGDLGDVTVGAASPNGYGIAAAAEGGEVLHFLGRSAPGSMTHLATLTFSDGRTVRAVRARADSFLVASARELPFQRLFLTLYRLSSGAAAPESLKEIAINFEDATDLAWNGDAAFVADGAQGVLAVNVLTGTHRSYPVAGSQAVRSLDADGAWVFAAASASKVARFQRVGAALDSLASYIDATSTLDPVFVRLHGSRVLVSTVDQVASQEPDESALSQIEFRNIDLTPYATPVGGTGRVRRVLWDAGYAYVADYTGGLRIYRAAGADTSLVGVLPIAGGRVVDLALDPARDLAYLAAGVPGLEIVDIADPANPTLISTVPLPGLTSAVAVAGGNLVLAGRRGQQSGVTVVDVTTPAVPAERGQVAAPVIQDPRAIAVKGNVAFVADEGLGLLAVDFSDPDQPATLGTPSGFATRDLHLSGNTLLAATRSSGLQIVDVFDPTSPILAATVPTPAVRGVGRAGNSAILCLGDEGMLVVDVSNPSLPVLRGPISIPGTPVDATGVGDTVLVATSVSLERIGIGTLGGSLAPITVEVDPDQVMGRARILWSPVSLPGAVGLHLYRDLLPAQGGGTDDPVGKQVNTALLPISTTEAVDDALVAGSSYRYRLEALLADGTLREVAEGTVYISSNQALGRPFPNPFRPGAGAEMALPFRLLPGSRSLELHVYDVSGRLVRKIAAGTFGGGFGEVTWDGRDSRGSIVAGGVYFLRIPGSGFDEGRTLVVLH